MRQVECTRIATLDGPAGRRLATTSRELAAVVGDSLLLFDPRTGKQRVIDQHTLDVCCIGSRAVGLGREGIFLATLEGAERLVCRLEGVPVGAISWRSAEGMVWAVALFPDQADVYMAGAEAPTTWTRVATIKDVFEIVDIVAAPGSLVLTGSAHGYGRQYYCVEPSGHVRRLEALPGDLHVLWSDRDARAIVGLRGDNLVERRSLQGVVECAVDLRSLDAGEPESADAGYVTGWALNENFVLCAGVSGRVYLVDVSTCAVAQLTCGGTQLTSSMIHCNADGSVLLVHRKGPIEIFHIDTAALDALGRTRASRP
jgi:hypothetical protein